MKRDAVQRMIPFLFLAVLCVSLCGGVTVRAEDISLDVEAQQSVALGNPQIVADSSMTAGQKVTWDCVFFGSYPQSEVQGTDSIYETLENASNWRNDEIVLNGNKYRRIKKENATFYSDKSSSEKIFYYPWPDSTTWHYFKYEPIKWRVLSMEGNRVLLLSDIALDTQKYNTEKAIVKWENSTIRSWLNGYGASSNVQNTDFSAKNFIGSAFDSGQQAAIISVLLENKGDINYGTGEGEPTKDPVFLLSDDDLYGDMAKLYGFVSKNDTATSKEAAKTYDEARRCKSSTYAKAMGAITDLTPGVKGNCRWWLRTTAFWEGTSINLIDVYSTGEVDYTGHGPQQANDVVRPALYLDLTKNQHEYAGKVDSGEILKDSEMPVPVIPKKPGEIKKPAIKVSDLSLSGISKKIAAGKKIKLTANISPANAADPSVIWSSSNTKVAKVSSSGVVTISKKSGGKTVTITATAADGSGVAASYKITCMKGVVKKVTLSGKKTVKVGKTLKLKGKVKASKKANTKLKWISSNTKYAKVSSSGKVKALKAGKGKKVKITAMATDGSGKKKSITIKIK